VRHAAFCAQRQPTLTHSRVQCSARVTLSTRAVGEHTPVKVGQATSRLLCESTREGGALTCLGVHCGVCTEPSSPEGKLRHACVLLSVSTSSVIRSAPLEAGPWGTHAAQRPGCAVNAACWTRTLQRVRHIAGLPSLPLAVQGGAESAGSWRLDAQPLGRLRCRDEVVTVGRCRIVVWRGPPARDCAHWRGRGGPAIIRFKVTVRWQRTIRAAPRHQSSLIRMRRVRSPEVRGLPCAAQPWQADLNLRTEGKGGLA